jgi:hypothetical protein
VYTQGNENTLDSRKDVKQRINVEPGKFGKKE